MTSFERAFARGLRGIEFFSPGFNCRCPECNPDGTVTEEQQMRGEYPDEPEFSWRACDACGSSLAGDRHAAHGFVSIRRGGKDVPELIHLEICLDCVFYAANGDLPAD